MCMLLRVRFLFNICDTQLSRTQQSRGQVTMLRKQCDMIIR
jgi:hypothetical protein